MSEKKNVLVICPICNKSKNIPIPKTAIQNADGLTTIKIPANISCEHSYQIYVDKNFIVRGYQKSDFEVGISKPAVKMQALDLSTIIKRFEEKTGQVLLEAMITKAPIFVIGVDAELIEKVQYSYCQFYPACNENLKVLTRIDYNKIWKNRIFSSEYRNAYVFDFELNHLVRSPSKDKPKFGKFLWDDIFQIRGEKAQSIFFINWDKKIGKIVDIVEELIQNTPNIKRKDILKFLKTHQSYNEKDIPFEIIEKRLNSTRSSDLNL